MKAVRSGFLAALVCCLVGVSPARAADPYPYRTIAGVSPVPLASGGLTSPQELEVFLDGVIAAQVPTHHLAGVGITIVKDGALFFSKGYGYADVAARRPVTADATLFEVASVSKLFVWTAVMQLVEQGKLDLDRNVNDYLTEFKIPDTFPQPITLRHVMTHTTGFEDGGLQPDLEDDIRKGAPLVKTLTDYIPRRVRPVGGLPSYSNWAADLAGYIVAQVSGQSFEDYAQTHILTPLGMTKSSFAEPLPSHLGAAHAKGYDWEDDRLTAVPHLFVYAPSGGLSATPADMAKFMNMFLQNGMVDGKTILSADSVQKMVARQFTLSPYMDAVGLGLFETTTNGRHLFGHGGSLPGFKTVLAFLPQEKVGIFITYNTNSGTTAYTQLLQAFMDRYYPASLPVLKPTADFAKRAQDYIGAYRTTRHNYTGIDGILEAKWQTIKIGLGDDGRLSFRDRRDIVDSWTEVAPDNFRSDKGDMIAFVRDDKGRVTAMVGPEPDYAAERVSWHEDIGLHKLLYAVSAAAFAMILLWFVIRRFKAREADKGSGLLCGLVAGVSFTQLLFLGYFGTQFLLPDDLPDMGDGYPPLLKASLGLPILAALLTAAAFLLFLVRLPARQGSKEERRIYLAALLLSSACLWSFHNWNLIGWNFT